MKNGALISDEYLAQNVELHETDSRYGGLDRFARYWEIAGLLRPGDTVLDYGCGKGRLSVFFEQTPHSVTNYDPATYPELPIVHDVVACMDVLEHVEPDRLGAVISHLRSVTGRLAYVVIPNAQGTRTLPDGRLAHLTVEGRRFWTDQLSRSFEVEAVESPCDADHEMTFHCL